MSRVNHGDRMRTTAEAVVRIQLVLLLPATLAAIGFAADRGGAWLALLGPAGVLLVGHARTVAQAGLRSWSGALVNVGMLSSAASVVLLVVLPLLGVYRTVTVLSGSMRPTFDPADMIVVTPEPMQSLRVGDVITFRIPTAGEAVETHRVVSIAQAGTEPIIQTKGDANNTVDPWHAQLHGATVWRYRFRLPGFGYPLLALRSRWAHWTTAGLLPLLIALWGLTKLWTRPPSSSTPGAPNASATA